VINERFTLILGKIKKSEISSYANTSIQKCLNQLNCIPIKDFIESFDLAATKYSELKKVLALVRYLNAFSHKSKINSDNIFQLYSLFQNFKNLLELNHLLKNKEKLLDELEISKTYEKEIALSTITELIQDLEESIKNNQKKLTYFEEDYHKHKNQIESIKEKISEYRNQIANLNKEKKSFFSEINKITRQFETTIEEKPKKNNKIEKNEYISNSERIKQLQNKAREIQFQINQLRAKIEEKEVKISKLDPQFKLYKEDHDKFTSLIQNDKTRIKELKEKLKSEFKESKIHLEVENQKRERIIFKTKKEIEKEMSLIEQKITQIEVPEEYYNPTNPQDFSKIQHEILELLNKVKNKKKEMQINSTETEFSQIIKQFEILENIVDRIESLINILLNEINLKTEFLITMKNIEEKLFIEIIFIRNEKERLKFEKLTTPEKVFFAVVFYITIEILNNSQCIIFSNLLIPDSYNKRGSIERTIKKIIPLFSTESCLSDIKLIFIISNLDIKLDINNLNLIKVEES